MPKFLTFRGCFSEIWDGYEHQVTAAPDPSCTYDIDGDDFTGGLLDLAKTAEEVPEAGLGNDVVRRKDAHPVQARSRVGLRGQMAPNHLVFLKTT